MFNIDNHEKNILELGYEKKNSNIRQTESIEYHEHTISVSD